MVRKSIHFICSRPLRNAFLVTLATTAMAGSAHAQLSSDSSQPIDVTGDKAEFFEEKGIAVWTGDVQVVQGESFLTTEKLVIHMDKETNDISKFIASNGLRYTNGKESLSGDNGVYIQSDDTLTVTGNVVALQDSQVMTGGKLIYNVASGKLKVSSDKSKRVRGIFYTEKKPGS